jgi:alcohol dehydrogenase (cytochrome c)
MMRFFYAAMMAACAVTAGAQSLDPSSILHRDVKAWPTYSGDYKGQRFSPIAQINTSNVHKLVQAWSAKLPGEVTHSGGVGTTVAPLGRVSGSIVQVDGVLFVTTPDNVWSLDAATGKVNWHYQWKTRGGTHIGNRGVGVWRDRVFFETPDNYLVALSAKTGEEVWHKEIASFDLQYFSTMAPHVIGDHLLVGTGNDLDEPGMLQSFNPQTGDVEWTWYATPTKKGDAGLETWASLDASSHGGGNVWVNGSYDPETHLYIFGTGNPSAAFTSQLRGPGANLYTCSTVAVNVDTGKLAWYYQTSPHDTHDYDSAQTQVLVDGTWQGKPRKLVMTMARNGYFFVLDRVTGEHLLTSKMFASTNWAEETLDAKGAPVRIPAKDFDFAGALVSPSTQGIVNWQPPAYSPQTGLFYVNTSETWEMFYLATTDPRGAMGLGGEQLMNLPSNGGWLLAIDYTTGKPRWKHRYPGVTGGLAAGVMTTAGHLLFAPDVHGNLIAYNAATGRQLWHQHISASNAPETFVLNGKQYVLAAGGDTLYAFALK